MVESDGGFGEFVAARQVSLLRAAWLLTGNGVHAQDLVQHALVKTLPRWRNLVDEGHPEAYVRKVMLNSYLSWWPRLGGREEPRADLPEAAAEDPGLARAELRAALVGALNRLPRRQRAVVVLRYYEDLSEAQTAAELGCSVGTVKSQASRGLAALREVMSIADESQGVRDGP